MLSGQELTEKTFSFATYARKAFISAQGKEGLELAKMPINESKKEALASVRTQWLGIQDSNLALRIQSPLSYR